MKATSSRERLRHCLQILCEIDRQGHLCEAVLVGSKTIRVPVQGEWPGLADRPAVATVKARLHRNKNILTSDANVREYNLRVYSRVM